jgi:predicted DCC family thiol-disulfide oxidoreductase YuxK
MGASRDLVLLYDGHCALCNGVVSFVLKRDKVRTMFFASLQGETGRGVATRHPQLGSVTSVALIDRRRGREEMLLRSNAVLAIAEYLGAPWSWLRVFRVVPRPLRDVAYNVVARARYNVFGRYDACPFPPAESRDRFLI